MDKTYHFNISPTFNPTEVVVRAFAAEIRKAHVLMKEKKTIEFDSRRIKDRREIPCFIDPDRRSRSNRRGRAARELEEKRKKEFNRHVKAQR